MSHRWSQPSGCVTEFRGYEPSEAVDLEHRRRTARPPHHSDQVILKIKLDTPHAESE
jgi:hypothetical protein